MRARNVRAAASVLAVVSFLASAEARELSFNDRVKAQEAIERVYYSHQIGTTRSFGEAVPNRIIENKVLNYLRQSLALETLWHTPITAEMLHRETVRMAEGTRMPERLRELYAALGNDLFLIEECLARPTLVDRLSRGFYAFDERVHGQAKMEAEALREALLRYGADAYSKDPRRSEIEIASSESEARQEGRGAIESIRRVKVSPDGFTRWRAQLPKSVGEIGPIREERDAFTIRIVEEGPVTARVATFTVAKKSWNEWWQAASDSFDAQTIEPVGHDDESAVVPEWLSLNPRGPASFGAIPDAPSAGMPAATCPPDDTWNNGSLDLMIEARRRHTAIWTGTLMIVWGGQDVFGFRNTGARYDPATDTWTPTSITGAPRYRTRHTAVWTGTRMVVWGGSDGVVFLNTGGSYDPTTDAWTPTSTAGAPVARADHTAVWTGSRVVIWGGAASTGTQNSGGRYDPSTDVWTTTSTVGAPAKRSQHTSVWTGNTMVVWGGSGSSPNLNTGGRYIPSTDTWMSLTTVAAPPGRRAHTAVWSGTHMIVWGGLDGASASMNTGGRYDPTADTWTATSNLGAPPARTNHTAVWTGSQMVVWGGSDAGNPLGSGGRYDPGTDSWTPTSLAGAPDSRYWHTAVWTGSHVVVWGGYASSYFNTGARYEPASDSWTPTATTGAPAGRADHTAVWSGSLMIVWGGYGEGGTNTGSRYDPATDSWTPTSTVDAPSARYSHTAVWTGASMIVWGGATDPFVFPPFTNTGGRYDPATDTWTPTSTAGAPEARSYHTTVWTGSSMIVWGGSGFAVENSGGRYDPSTDSWMPTSSVGAPSERSEHRAVWSGSEMIVWGGNYYFDGEDHYTSTGGRYDPVGDSWVPTSTAAAPTPRGYFDSVWTGRHMIVWGGWDGSSNFDTGGRYDPLTDSWTPTSTSDAPSARSTHSMVWTGDVMVVWGGYDAGYADTGGRYDPAADAWVPTSTVDVPAGRRDHTAVSTGGQMIVWGGFGGTDIGRLSTGGVYWLSPDLDNDGFTVCGGDCNDGNVTIHPGAIEVCNGIDDNCDQLTDNDIPAPPDRPTLTEEKSGTTAVLLWSAASGATGYDVVKGSVGVLLSSGGDFTSSTTACLADDLAATTVNDTEVPLAGSGLWYLLRAVNSCGGNGTYDEAPGSQQGSRDAEIEASPNACP